MSLPVADQSGGYGVNGVHLEMVCTSTSSYTVQQIWYILKN